MSTTSGIFGTSSGFLGSTSGSACAQLYPLDSLKRTLQSIYIQGDAGALATTPMFSLTMQGQSGLLTPMVHAPTLVITPSGIPLLIESIRERSALTLDEIATIMGVSRRSLHNWKNGEAVATGNEASLRALDHTLKQIQGGNGASVRDALMQLRDGGLRVFDLLVEGRHESAVAVANGSSPMPAISSEREELSNKIASRLNPSGPITPVSKPRVLSRRLSQGRR